MLFTIYKITNTINQKIYIGVHKTNDLDDGYMGSGVAITNAINKYGKDTFVKEIICLCKTEYEMYEKEKELVEVGVHSYNMTNGGKGGWSHIDSKGDNNPMRRSAETRAKVSASSKLTRNDPEKKAFYDNISRENFKKATEHNTGQKRPNHSIIMKQKGQLKTQWIEHREEMRDRLSSYFELTSPDNVVYTTNRLMDFCKEHNIPYNTVWNTSNTGKPSNRGKAKGWLCKKI